MSKVVLGALWVVLTTLPFFLRYVIKQKYEKLRKALQDQEDDSYYQCLFFGPKNFSCKSHFYDKKECGEFCSFTQFERLIHYIVSAKKSVSLCMYILTLKQVQTSLIQLNRKGIKVRIITDKVMHQTKVAQELFAGLKENGIEFRIPDSTEQLMHNKYCLIDETDEQHAKVFFGSLNLTSQAVLKNFESVILTNNKDIIGRLSDEFEYLWRSLKES
ncbi:mitochondrial cardiolipin hydrolase zuc [Rhynchophorus ferrugineus]|uniref:Mitochondrial cardiolipin hydrolase n=1 Tax=Rhynchophorus ferrugineus TaxID=354439 RepID=A0A834IPE5_RHYFE|nr:hypothetical protein GWI33_022995 [Rhynchophorus ferrugineus]